jgi:uncharacterized protein YacL
MIVVFGRAVVTICGTVVGPLIVVLVYDILQRFFGITPSEALTPAGSIAIYILSGILTGIIFYFLSKRIVNFLVQATESSERHLNQLPLSVIVYGAMGLIVGLVIAFLISMLINMIPAKLISMPLSLAVYAILGYLGAAIAIKRRDELSGLRGRRWRERGEGSPNRVFPKILDTSVIIDGRIYDIFKTGFVEGPVVVPGFVLQELRHIADSADPLRRNRGRRGLDVLNRIQRELAVEVEVPEEDYEDLAEVDMKLLRMAQKRRGKVITNDYNLNKVAEVQGVEVLNINELANAMKPVALPGEEMAVEIVKEGKEPGQGVAYLNDGTMIVVDGGRRHMGERVDVLVTSVLQTAAGRMIFAKLKNMDF